MNTNFPLTSIIPRSDDYQYLRAIYKPTLQLHFKAYKMTVDPFLPFMLRIILGSLFFFQAYDKLFRIGLEENYRVFAEDCKQRNVPLWFMKVSTFLSSYIELIGGALLILGFFTSYAMLALGINLMMVSIAFGYLQGLWDMRHVYPRIILLALLYFIPTEQDVWSIDYLTSIAFPID